MKKTILFLAVAVLTALTLTGCGLLGVSTSGNAYSTYGNGGYYVSPSNGN